MQEDQFKVGFIVDDVEFGGGNLFGLLCVFDGEVEVEWLVLMFDGQYVEFYCVFVVLICDGVLFFVIVQDVVDVMMIIEFVVQSEYDGCWVLFVCCLV